MLEYRQLVEEKNSFVVCASNEEISYDVHAVDAQRKAIAHEVGDFNVGIFRAQGKSGAQLRARRVGVPVQQQAVLTKDSESD